MSQVEITLRPLPERGYLEGFPGIPSNSVSCPSPALRGEIEVRAPLGQLIELEWIRVELVRTESPLQESLAGIATIAYAPVISTIHEGKLAHIIHPFSIPIPLDAPSSFWLDEGGGIAYFLLATACFVNGGWYSEASAPRTLVGSRMISDAAIIPIEKHELHARWPIHRQLQSATTNMDPYSLTMMLNASCYGPGDEILAKMELSSSREGSTILGDWTITLWEVATFRPHSSSAKPPSKPPPWGRTSQTRQSAIFQQTRVLGGALYEGDAIEQELTIQVPRTCRTPTSRGRFLQVQFALSVKVDMEGPETIPETIELEVLIPVTLSQWTKEASDSLMSDIGRVPELENVNFPYPSLRKNYPNLMNLANKPSTVFGSNFSLGRHSHFSNMTVDDLSTVLGSNFSLNPSVPSDQEASVLASNLSFPSSTDTISTEGSSSVIYGSSISLSSMMSTDRQSTVLGSNTSLSSTMISALQTATLGSNPSVPTPMSS